MSRPSSKRVLVTAIVALVVLGEAPAGAATTGRHNVQTWTANLRRMGHDGDRTIWKKLVRRMAAHRLLPDVIALNEVCDSDVGGARGNDARQFMRYLEATVGARYSYRHSSTGRGPCWAADTMVVWRTRRFSVTGVTRWMSLADESHDGDRRCTTHEDPSSAQIGVALRDRLQDKSLVLGTVHFPVPDTRRCINENAAVTDRKLEELRPTRRLTILGGDFNQVPQRDRPVTGDELAAGTQVDPNCWYRSLSLLTTRDRRECPAGQPASPAHYRPRTDHYVDAVHADHQGSTPGTASSAICEEWTHARAGARDGTSCTDVSGRGDGPDGRMDRGRIDYLWARWELGGGRPRSFEPTQADELVHGAQADKVQPPRYSDHRAVRALISWCLPDESCAQPAGSGAD